MTNTENIIKKIDETNLILHLKTLPLYNIILKEKINLKDFKIMKCVNANHNIHFTLNDNFDYLYIGKKYKYFYLLAQEIQIVNNKNCFENVFTENKIYKFKILKKTENGFITNKIIELWCYSHNNKHFSRIFDNRYYEFEFTDKSFKGMH